MAPKAATLPPGVSRATAVKWSALATIYLVAFATRMFSVLRFESVIHEFDPYFNFRSTKFLAVEGMSAFEGWFDDRAWYPLGRIVGTTVYPGLMATASLARWLLEVFNFPLDIRNICVFLAPFMASNAAMAMYCLGKEVVLGPCCTAKQRAVAAEREHQATGTGLLAAAFLALVPGYTARSVAGSFDNEGVAIFAMVLTFACWIRAVHRGSSAWAGACAAGYLYMASAWGGYVFIINLIPLHAALSMLSGAFSDRMYTAYSTFFVIGTLLSVRVPFVGLQPTYSAEHMAAAVMFAISQLWWAVRFARSLFGHDRQSELRKIQRTVTVAFCFGMSSLLLVGLYTDYLASFTGRFYMLLDPTYAKEYIPLIASVSEHQPTAWSSFFFDLHILVTLTPVGMWYCCRRNATDGQIFALIFAVTSVYFAGVMVRLMLVLAPAACLLSSIAVSEVLSGYMPHVRYFVQQEMRTRKAMDASEAADKQRASARGTMKAKGRTGGGHAKLKRAREQADISDEVGFFGLLIAIGMTMLLILFAVHCAWVTVQAYSSPSIVLPANANDGSRVMFDDFREAYWWLRQNTPDDAKVMSWWDYGYQISAMANRTVIVDNNTWNNTHIATVGAAMASSEKDAMAIMESLDVDYVLVIFGGVSGFSGDDINKFLWMLRIGGGEFPHIQESDYQATNGDLRIDGHAADAMRNSLLYKLSYHRFDELTTDYGQAPGFDRVRNQVVGESEIKLSHFEEVLTSEHWIVRIFRVKRRENPTFVMPV